MVIEKFPNQEVTPEEWREFSKLCVKFESAIMVALRESSENLYQDYTHICHALLRVLAWTVVQNKDENMDELVIGTLGEYLKGMREEKKRRKQDAEEDKTD